MKSSPLKFPCCSRTKRVPALVRRPRVRIATRKCAKRREPDAKRVQRLVLTLGTRPSRCDALDRLGEAQRLLCRSSAPLPVNLRSRLEGEWRLHTPCTHDSNAVSAQILNGRYNCKPTHKNRSHSPPLVAQLPRKCASLHTQSTEERQDLHALRHCARQRPGRQGLARGRSAARPVAPLGCGARLVHTRPRLGDSLARCKG